MLSQLRSSLYNLCSGTFHGYGFAFHWSCLSENLLVVLCFFYERCGKVARSKVSAITRAMAAH
jgi:hypothetical protein